MYIVHQMLWQSPIESLMSIPKINIKFSNAQIISVSFTDLEKFDLAWSCYETIYCGFDADLLSDWWRPDRLYLLQSCPSDLERGSLVQTLCQDWTDFAAKLLHYLCERHFVWWALYFCIEPSAPPSKLRSHPSSSTSVLVEWDELPQEHSNGNIQGYKVLCSASDEPELTKTVDTSTRQVSMTSLRKATVYTIKVLAFTSIGDGPASAAISVATAEDGRCMGRFYLANSLPAGNLPSKRFKKKQFKTNE